MQSVIRRALPSALPGSLRILAQRRLPLAAEFPRTNRTTTAAAVASAAVRCFHPSRKILGGRDKLSPSAADSPSRTLAAAPASQDPAQKTNDSVQVPPEEEQTHAAEGVSEEIVTETGPSGGNGSSDGRPRARGRPAGPKKRQGAKSKEEILQPEEVPEWFINRSVRLLEESIASPGDSKATIVSSCTEYLPSRLPGAWPADALSDVPTDGDFKKALHAGQQRYQLYYLEENVWREIVATAKAGLMVSKPSSAHSLAAMKSHCILHSPCRGGVYHLDAVVNRIAEDVGADVVRIDPLDLEEMVGDSVGDSRLATASPMSSFSIRSLGYDAYAPPKDRDSEEMEDSDDEYGSDSEQSDPPPPRVYRARWVGNLPTSSQQPATSGQPQLFVATLVPLTAEGDQSNPEQSTEHMIEHVNEQKTWAVLEALVGAAQIKRAQSKQASGSESSEPSKEQAPPTQKTIIHVRDFRELERTSSGQAIIRILYEVVLKRRSKGESIMVVGTTSAEESPSTYCSKPDLRALQAQPDNSFERTIVVPPHTLNIKCQKDHPVRFREINLRHLGDMIRRKSGAAGEAVSLVLPKDYRPEHDEFDDGIPGCGGSVWSFEYVHRLATFILGDLKGKKEVGLEDARQAVEILERSDSVKVEWAAAAVRANDEFDRLMKEIEDAEVETTESGQLRPITKRKVKIPRNCTPHEKKLLGGVIDPADIQTGFSSVRAPEDTIESLKTLTSMSLIRPEAFKYGVLASDRIPGLLLYGPPGTGKTLLARAVAKESGATVLEVSGSEVFDMYVGEGEKNVKAIFSLARKLSPCVVFIDEADAIFGSRHSHSARTTHREIINQFLKEWADMHSTAFIMVATNRPFDLDDAVLRRLPRRILVDLPTMEDRHEILKIHLAAEALGPSVSLQSIANQTTLFSGSDLKNLCVSAALSCVKEENAMAASAKTKGQPFKFPEKRTLEERHFVKAMEEITASISDDMSSLTAIRKFDEKYGEKSGKKKKRSNWGFGIGDQSDQRGSGRVRAD